jgi:hypothetical protein
LIAVIFAGCLAAPQSPTNIVAPGTTKFTPPVDLPKVDAQQFLVNHKKFVTLFPQRAGNTDTHKGAREYLAQQFHVDGLVSYRLNYTKGIPQEDICAVKLGVGKPADWVLMGGHYDTTTWDSVGPAGGASAPGTKISQGAYDDGSGTWLTVEIARAFAKVPSYYSILFCAYDGEERGTQGAQALKVAMEDSSVFPYPVDEVHAILDLDMIGINWPTHTPIYVTQNNKALFDKVDAYRKNVLKIPDNMFVQKGLMPVLGSSDYAVWMFDKSHPRPGLFYISDFSECGVPVPAENPAPVPGVPCSYPWWHWIDTTETMTAMAGGPAMSQAGFQTALNLSIYSLSIMAYEPDLKLE